jgi:uncharacterized protein (TIGR00251 family)
VRLTVRVTPRGGRDAIDGWIDGADGQRTLRVRVAAPASDGRANDALVRLLAKAARVPASSVRILAGGARSRVKLIEIDDVNELRIPHDSE